MIVRQYVMTSDVYSFMDLPIYYELENNGNILLIWIQFVF